jgi:hypothetical protein
MMYFFRPLLRRNTLRLSTHRRNTSTRAAGSRRRRVLRMMTTIELQHSEIISATYFYINSLQLSNSPNYNLLVRL